MIIKSLDELNKGNLLTLWTTTTRPASPTVGYIGKNTTLGVVETWNGSNWVPVGGLTLMTAQTASGTSVDFTGIPSWVKRITVMFNGVSTNGSSVPIIRLGATTIQTTGYLTTSGAVGSGNAAATQTDGFHLAVNATAASNIFYGKMELVTMGSNVWIQDNQLAYPNVSNQLGQGLVTLSGTLDRIRLTTVNGTDTFDAGTINIMYEG